MIKSLHLQNFTVFERADLQFGALNVIHGENSSGKTHLLKLLYSAAAVAATPTSGDKSPVKSRMNRTLAEKLLGVFKPDKLGHLARNTTSASAVIRIRLNEPNANFNFTIGPKMTAEVAVDEVPAEWRESLPVYLPPRELLSLQPEFVGLATERFLPFDETWLDTSRMINMPLFRGQKGKEVTEMLKSLERAIGGELSVDKSGRFSLMMGKEQIEMHMVAEGLRKLATVVRLLSNRSLQSRSALFWDEPEANLNPRLIRQIAPILSSIAASGMQVFVATHSLFLLRELYLEQQAVPKDVRYFGLHWRGGAVQVDQSQELDDTGDLAALDESLAQSQRYLEWENKQ